MTDKEKKHDSGESASGSGDASHSREKMDEVLERQALDKRLSKIRHKLLVLSGKGGVGKSTVAVNLALSLAMAGRKVGLMDIDIHGPSIPKLLDLVGLPIQGTKEAVWPVKYSNNLSVISIAFFLQDQDNAVIWRGPMKFNMIKQFIKDVEWGELDYLVVDSPPGTGDEPLSIVQMIQGDAAAIIVTTPQELALADVRKCIDFCRKVNVPVLGVVENMSGFICPECHAEVNIFKKNGGFSMASEMGVPFLGSIPIDPGIVEACDSGKPYVLHYSKSETAARFRKIIEPIMEADAVEREISAHLDSEGNLNPDSSSPRVEADDLQGGKADVRSSDRESEGVKGITEAQEGIESMKIAIPVAAGRLSMHFGHCEEFAIFEVDPKGKKILKRETIAAPDHQPGLLPRWLHEKGAEVIIAGGMGQRAQGLFMQNQIRVVIGARGETPEDIVNSYLSGDLVTGDNICDH